MKLNERITLDKTLLRMPDYRFFTEYIFDLDLVPV
jgi:hypothetical protein